MVHLARNWRPRRSVLFMPASNERAMEKARGLACDGVIFDLEDSVAPGEQALARATLRRMGARQHYGQIERIVRVSAHGTPEFDADLEAALAIAPDAILLPKVESVSTLAAARGRIGAGGPALWAMVETARAIVDISEIAGAPEDIGLAALVIGPNDLAVSIGVPLRPGRAAMVPWFMNAVSAARAHGLAVLDGVYNNFRDEQGFVAECLQGADLGFDGKTLIHPSQIEVANLTFGPQPEEIARARRIVIAFDLPENRDAGVISLDGEMVERLHLNAAKRLLKVADTLGTAAARPPSPQFPAAEPSGRKRTGTKMTTLYRFLTGTDDTNFCNKVTQALAEGWKLYGETHYFANPVTGAMHCGQAVIKETDAPYDAERKLGEFQTFG